MCNPTNNNVYNEKLKHFMIFFHLVVKNSGLLHISTHEMMRLQSDLAMRWVFFFKKYEYDTLLLRFLFTLPVMMMFMNELLLGRL